MSRVIDSRTVEMTFDNSKFAKNCDSTLKQLDDLDRTLSKTASGADFSGAEKALTNLGKAGTDSAGQLADSLSSLESRFSAWGTFVGRVVEDVADKFVGLASTVAKSLAEASTLGAMKDGLAEYNLLMESMQSMSVLTHKSTDEINAMFDKLNSYADRTKYSFADMTRNLSMFAASGATLDQMEVSMEGIANWMAAVGAPASDMQRIIYNIGQAFSKGYLQLIDWKSIENSKGMNGQQFVERFVENAYKLGKMKADMYAEAVAAMNEGNLSGWFRESISGKDSFKGFDKDVMLATFKDFAENPEYIKAATQLKTFSEFLDNVKEEMGSGWQQTWRAVIGDLDQATTLFKGLKDSLTEYWDLGGEKRNELIDEFNKLGGAGQTYSILTNMVKIVGELKKSFMSGFSANFEEITGYDMWQKALEIATKVRHTLDDMQNNGSVWTDIFERLGDVAGNALANIGKFGSGIATLFHTNSEGLGQIALKVGDLAYAFTDRLFSSIGKIGDKIGELSKGPLTDIISTIGAIAYAGLDLIEWATNSAFIGKAFNSVWKSLEDGVDSIELIKNGLSGLGEYLDSARISVVEWAMEMASSMPDDSIMRSLLESFIAFDAKLRDMEPTFQALGESWSDCWERVHEGDWTAFSEWIKSDLIPVLEQVFSFSFDDLIGKLQDIAWWRPDFSQFIADMQEIWGSLEFGSNVLENIKEVLSAVAESFISFWHRITSNGLLGSGFTDIKSKLGLDDTKAFKLEWLEDIFNLFKKGSEDVEKASDTIITSYKEIQKAFSGPEQQIVKMQSLSLDEAGIDEDQLSLWDKLKAKFSGYWEYVKTIDINEDGIANWLKLFGAIGLVKVLQTIASALKTFAEDGSKLADKLDPFAKVPEKISKVLGGIYDSLEAYTKKLSAEAFATKWKAIALTFGVIVASIAVFGGLEKLGVDVMGNAMVVAALFTVLIKVMEAAQNFATGWGALDSISLAAACYGFAKIITSMTICITALTLLSKEWGDMDYSQLLQIFGYFGLIIGTAYMTLTSVGKMMAGMNTSIEWVVMYVVLGSIGKLFKTMAVTLAGLTLLEKYANDSTSNAMMSLLAIWGMIELLVVTIMGFATKSTANKGALLEAIGIMYMVGSLFKTMGLLIAELTIANELSDNTGVALLQLTGIFGIIEGLLWSVVGIGAVVNSTGIITTIPIITASMRNLRDLMLACGLVVGAFAVIGPDKINVALGEVAIVLGELMATMLAYSAIDRFINGGVSLNTAGLVAVIGAMTLVVFALAAFEAACAQASVEQINTSIKMFSIVIGEMALVLAGFIALGAIASAAGPVGAAVEAAIAVLAGVWVAIGAGALLAAGAGLAMANAIDVVIGALGKLETLDMTTIISKADELLEFFEVRLPVALLKATANIVAGFQVIRPMIAAQTVALLSDTLSQLAIEMPKFIAATDALVAASIAQFTLDLAKYGSLIVAAIIVDIDELATLVQTSQGIITAMGRLGNSLVHTLVASLIGEAAADKFVPVADSFTGQLKDALERKIPELNDRGYFMMDAITTGMESKADESKYSLFNKGKESSEQYGQGLISNNDVLSAFGIQMGTQAGSSLASEEVQSVYNRAGMTNATAYGNSFLSPEMQSLMEQFGINTGSILGNENVLGAFSASGSLDMSSYYQKMFEDNPELKAQLEQAGVDTGALLSNETIKTAFGDSGVADIEEFNAQQQYQLRTQRDEMVQYAAEEVKNYYQSKDVQTSAQDSGKLIASTVSSGMTSSEAKTSMETGGAYLVQGASNGMNREANKSGGILDTARNIADRVSSMFRRAWNEHSPSRVADEIGAFFGMGLDNGLFREGMNAVATASTVAEDITQAFTSGMDTSGFDNTLTITPEVDLGNVERAAQRTSKLFNNNKAMQMSAQYALAGTDGAAFGNTYNINVNETDANNGYSVGRDIERYLIRRY